MNFDENSKIPDININSSDIMTNQPVGQKLLGKNNSMTSSIRINVTCNDSTNNINSNNGELLNPGSRLTNRLLSKRASKEISTGNPLTKNNSSSLLMPNLAASVPNSTSSGHYHPVRRESFLYRADVEFDNAFSKLQNRSASIVSYEQ